MPERLLSLMIELFTIANSGDRSKFPDVHKSFTSWYKKATDAEQGEYHHQWAAWLSGQSKKAS